MNQREIGILTVLNEINTPLDGDQPRVFSIGWIRKTKGAKRGTCKTVLRCQKYSKNPSNSAQDESGTMGGFRLKENKTLLLQDLNEGKKLFVGIETIISFNGYRVRH